MQTDLNEQDEEIVKLESICEELNVELKLVLELISRYKQKKPHLKKQFLRKKQSLSKLIHSANQFNDKVIKYFFLNNFFV